MDDWRLLFGKIAPSTFYYGAEFRRMMPPGVEMAITTQNVKVMAGDDLQRAREARLASARMLEEFGVDCIIAGGGPVSTTESIEAEKQFVEDARDELSVPFSTSLESQTAAFRALDASSLLVLTPFLDPRDQELQAYLEYSGFDVVGVGGESCERVSDVRHLPRGSVYKRAKELVETTGADFDLVYVACAAWESVPYIDAIEDDTGRPVVTSTQAQLWNALRMAKVTPSIEGYGTLMA